MQIVSAPPAHASTSASSGARFVSQNEGELTLIIVALGIVVILAVSSILWKRASSPDEATRAYALILILIGTMVLICAGYSNDQIAPAMGLFGTVAGYLLGRKETGDAQK